MYQPTKEQTTAIHSDAGKIAISASAGSGKTTTMINRIVRILQVGNSTLEQLLVLTFTEASAKDMRKKLKKQLGDKISPVELQAAAIGTFHSFCAKIVRAWFTVAEVSPSFAVIDEIASAKLQNEVFEQVVHDYYEQAQAAVDLFAATRTLEGLRAVILQINNFLHTRVDAERWLDDVALTCYDANLDQNLAVRALLDDYHQVAAKYRQAVIDLGHQSPQVQFMLDVIEQILAAKTYADFQKLVGLTFPTIKKEPGFAAYEEFKTLRSNFRDQVLKPLNSQFTVSPAELQQDILADRQIVEKLLFLVKQFDAAYSAKKLSQNKMDFADLEKYALKVLHHAEAAAAIREQFKYIFVDEGQDTNPVQFAIIDLLRGDDKFFYIVGDVKQSIYGFRGCEPDLFDAITTADQVQALHFNHNFRSNDPILQFVNDVFVRLLPTYQNDHAFVLPARPDVDAINAAVKIELAADVAAQMELVYQQIVAARRPWSEIAILSETTKHFLTLKKYLCLRGVPCVVDRATDALQEPEIVLLNNLLFAALNPTNELARYLTMQYLCKCTNDDLAQIKLGKKAVPEIDAVLTKYHDLARTLSTGEVLTIAATEFGLLAVPTVAAFLTAIRDVGDFDTVARYLYLVEHGLVQVNINLGSNVLDAVRIMTIHNAKGLEFPVVILFDAGSAWSRHQDRGKITLDKNLGVCVVSVDQDAYVKKSPVLRLGIAKQQQTLLLAEKKRLLYVAITRPKSYLYIVGTWQQKQLLLQPNCLLDLINPTNAVEREDVVPSPELPVTAPVATAVPTLTAPVTDKMTLVKQSVTALVEGTATPTDETVMTTASKFNAPGGKDYGTAFHQQVQYGELPTAVADLVAGYMVYKEMPFLYQHGPTIVQGIMDLVAVKDRTAIIVDYKTTRLPVDALVAKYREQLRLYAAALPEYTVQTYLYSTVHQKLIAVSF